MTDTVIKRYLLILFNTFIVICLIDGVLDIGAGVTQRVKPAISAVVALGTADDAQRIRQATVRDRIAIMRGIPTRFVPGVGNVLEPTTAPGVTIGPDGERLHGRQMAGSGEAAENGRGAGAGPRASDNRQILLLGASQAFGYLNTDENTLAARLEHQMPGVTVRNFAGAGQPIAASVMVLKQRIAAGDRIDRAILIGGAIDTLALCTPRIPQAAPLLRPFLLDVARSLRDKADPASEEVSCTTPETQRDMAERVIYEIESALAFADRHHIRLTIIIPPAPYDGDASQVIDPDELRRVSQYAGPAVRTLRDRIATMNLPGVVDLGDAFDDRADGFYDAAGHFTDAGNEKMAQAIAAIPAIAAIRTEPAIATSRPDRPGSSPGQIISR